MAFPKLPYYGITLPIIVKNLRISRTDCNSVTIHFIAWKGDFSNKFSLRKLSQNWWIVLLHRRCPHMGTDK